MTTNELIRTIRYRFGLEELFGNASLESYNVQASIEKYAMLCQVSLQQHYPNAKIVVERNSQALVEVDEQEEGIDVERVKYICSHIHENRDWEVPVDNSFQAYESEELRLLNDIAAELRLSIAVLRWACEQKLIESATKQGILWQVAGPSCRRFIDKHLSGASSLDVWQLEQAEDQVPNFIGWDYSNALVRPRSELKEGTHLILGDLSRFRIPTVFTRSNCFLELHVQSNDIKLDLWFFNDVEEWYHPNDHSFSQFCKGFANEAQKLDLIATIQPVTDPRSRNLGLLTLSARQVPERDTKLEDIISGFIGRLRTVRENTELALLGGPVWKREYETNERLFCEEVLEKLLRQMNFEDVDYSHGSTEFGKDFTFTEVTPFGARRYYGLQAKAGNISGRIKGDMDEIIAQLDDAFAIPYRYSQQPEEQRFISSFVIAISGRFSDNAEEKIRWKLLKQGRLGMVYLWDKDKIQEMIHRYWLGEDSLKIPNAWTTNVSFLHS